MIRHAALGLKNCAGIDKGKFKQRFGLGFEEEFGKTVELLEGFGLGTLRAGVSKAVK